jgi:hypothetical protein
VHTDAGQQEGEQSIDPLELQRTALLSLPVSKLLGLQEYISSEAKTSLPADNIDVESVINQSKQALTTGVDMNHAIHLANEVKKQMDDLRKRRRCVQSKLPVQNACRIGLEKAIQRVEDSMQNAGEDLNQCEVVGKALQELISLNPSSSAVEARYKSVYSIAKRERVVKKVVAEGPDLSNSKERVMKEGLTAEAAVKAEQPLVYHKGLQKWIPLPSGDDFDNWRD